MVDSLRGRPPGPSQVREMLLIAAEEHFVEFGFAGASTRRIAEEVGVSHPMVNYYFGGKDGLFSAVLDLAMSPGRVLDVVAEGTSRQEFGARLLNAAVSLWDSPKVQQRLGDLLRSAAEGGEEGEALRGYLQSRVVGKLADLTGGPDAQARASAAAAVIAGVFLTRYVLELEPVASMTQREVVEAMAPALQAALAGRPRRRTHRR